MLQKLHLEEFLQSDGSLAFKDSKALYKIIEKLSSENIKNISAGELNGLQLLIKIYRQIISAYTIKNAPSAWKDIYEHILHNSDQNDFNQFKDQIQKNYAINEDEIIFESLIIWFCNQNEAFQKFSIFFDDKKLKKQKTYHKLIEFSKKYFSEKPKIAQNYSLLELILIAMKKGSIQQQLEFIRTHFGELLGDLLWQLLEGLDILNEETTFRGGGPGPTQIYDFSDEEYERFSEDQDWMSKLVLLAKSTYVWLAQLSRKYDREISRLDQVPPEELQEISDRGFSGIWLIGIWERSDASRKFKQQKGDQEAIASAYSLKNYHVAHELGGNGAMHELQKKAWHFGMRIGCDMVPNHMGIDSDWIVQHPDWFLQENEPPFPSYNFHSQNLSDRGEIEIFLEDHYFDESDAAVVFKLYDKRDGRSRYIYHGNDGTSIPWNDTAQLNYLLPEVREAVIKEIISIAKRFPVIRFDAAMTLAKKHIQRLWFPERGSGGAIPGRSRHAMSREEFNYHIPNEFWREVVDRVAQEAPDTLLLAEAFWMMEGYFVRTLGMHRVYNSAFMNMLKAEENQKYRESIKNVLEFNPQILKRFVNFMSNPDEETAISQFGTDDKYFGVCILMATMPGLPMFAHGQIEGFTERYGMEFSKPKMWENPNRYMVERHQKEIFPLLKKRELFSDVEKFVLYDFVNTDGHLNENVFAYSNEFQGQRSLVVYHNVFQETWGNVHHAKKPVFVEDNIEWQQVTLAELWNLHNEDNWITIFKDAITGLSYIRRSKDLYDRGMFLKLSAFKYHVFWEVVEVYDTAGIYARLHDHLHLEGTKNINRELKRMEYADLLDSFAKLISKEFLKQLILKWKAKKIKDNASWQKELNFRISKNISELVGNFEVKKSDKISKSICENIQNVVLLNSDDLSEKEKLSILLVSMLEPLIEIFQNKFGKNWYHDSLIDSEINSISEKFIPELEEDFAFQIGVILDSITKIRDAEDQLEWLKMILQKPRIIKFLAINEFEEKIWFNLESFAEYIKLMESLILLFITKKRSQNKWLKFFKKIKQNLISSEYQVEVLLESLGEEKPHEK
ncbi:MAG: hypothetical protein K9N09_01135 [Candidatus Cloacimonetes bacterium]|nr:hypothetical protein [Candidatus Cloacimonadota bacterium]MCF7812990.1 hypothetical protein [Candidatus Cloacimonadota bacterium]MCF7867278.1 hypothetical protein [Candidatus Cloacimonadota bacterium]